jgi:hypothetical protein
MKKRFLIFVVAILLVGCATPTPVEVEISEIEYKQALGLAVCEVVAELNSRGALDDEKIIANEFDPLLQNSLAKMGYPAEEWLAAKAKYFPDEAEHTKLVKMHFAWCLVGDSFE